jgi:hypothetical protein
MVAIRAMDMHPMVRRSHRRHPPHRRQVSNIQT